MTRLLLAATLLASTYSTAAFAHDTGKAPGVIHVTASASAETAPDRAMLSGGVMSQAPTARQALSDNSAKMEQVFAALRGAGIADRDIATSSLSVQPDYDYQARQNGQPFLRGYNVSNQVTVTTTELDSVGPLIDTLIDAGMNSVNNVVFTVQDQDAAQNKARAEAIAKARNKAQTMALAAGVRLGRLLSMTEGSQAGAMYDQIMPTALRVQATSASAQVMPGQREIAQTVTLSYAID